MPHQTVRFNVCICMYVAMCDVIRLVGYRLLCHQSKESVSHLAVTSKAHMFVTIEATQLKPWTYKLNVRLLTRHMNLLPVDHPSSSSRCYSFEVNCFGLSAVTSITNSFAIRFIVKPWNIHSSRGVKSIV